MDNAIVLVVAVAIGKSYNFIDSNKIIKANGLLDLLDYPNDTKLKYLMLSIL